MTQQLVQGTPAGPLAAFADRLPPMIASADDRTAWRFVDFFAVTIRNPNTREAYFRAVTRFMNWCEQRGLHRFSAIRPIHVAAYVEQLPLSRPSVRQHLSAISRWRRTRAMASTKVGDGLAYQAAVRWVIGWRSCNA